MKSALLFLLVGAGVAQADSVASPPPCYTQRENSESDWEAYLAANPDDTKVAACLLDYYAQRLNVTKLEPRRMRMIRWVVENHPDIQLQGHLEFGLRIRADTAEYPEIRELWRAQLDRSPGVVRILLNAAASLATADSELAAAWLSQARALEPENFAAVRALGQLYAGVIIGLARPGADLLPTAIDPSLANSPFAQRAWREANQDAALATATAIALHSWVKDLRYRKITDKDYDPLAEQLLERAQNLQYPRATLVSALRDFYREQAWKRGDPSEHLTPTSKIVDLPSKQALDRLDLSRSAYAAQVGHFVCEIVVGTDGHVWTSAAAREAPESSEKAVDGFSEGLVFRPLRLNGEPVRFRTNVIVQSMEHCAQP
jgi:hypothetical protein